ESFVRVALGYDTAQYVLGINLDQSVALLTEAEAKIARDDDKRRCLIVARLARAHLLLGDAEKSESYGRRGAELAHRLGDRSSLFTVLANRFAVPRQVASLGDAQSRLSEANELVELSRGISDDEMKGTAIVQAAYVAAELGDRARLNQLLAALTEATPKNSRFGICDFTGTGCLADSRVRGE